MKHFEEYFSKKAIIHQLCKQRIVWGEKRGADAYLQRICPLSLPIREFPWPGIFPPRKLWHSFRTRNRNGLSARLINIQTLQRSVETLGQRNPEMPWVSNLERTVEGIRTRVLSQDIFRFNSPRIIPQAKSENTYRPIAIFTPEDKLIDGLVAKYFRELFDDIFLPSSLAFRCAPPGGRAPESHDAIDIIAQRREKHAELFVAEVDLVNFFDCVDHEAVMEALARLTNEAIHRDPNRTLNSRAQQILESFLAIYTFGRNVRGEAAADLRLHHSGGVFPWPEEALKRFHNEPCKAPIGIPQGGSLSLFLVNCLLHRADDEMNRLQAEGLNFSYLRYCDDMILLGPDRHACNVALDRYKSVMTMLHLPAHPATKATTYAKEYWSKKSTGVYRWGKSEVDSDIPWIQFVGYQMRYDGVMRISKKSFKKHKKRLLQEADTLLHRLNPGKRKRGLVSPFAPGIRLSPEAILLRFKRRLVNLSVGQQSRHANTQSTRCWTHGFKALKGRSVIIRHFEELDRYRERQVRRLARRLNLLGLTQGMQLRSKIFMGFPHSYSAQFKD
jgi:hypothetical protein